MYGSVLLFESKRVFRNFPTVFFGLAFPVMMLLIFGGIYGNDPADQFGGQGTIDVSVPAYVGIVLAVTGLMSFPIGMVEYRSRSFLRRLRATPARPTAFLTGQIIGNGVVCVLGVILLIATGMIGYDLSSPEHPWAFAGLVILAALSMFGIGLLIASIARSESTALVLANLIYFPMIFLTGATIPLEIMPDTMQDIANVLPLTYAIDALKWAWLDTGGDAMTTSLLVTGGTIVVCGAVSLKWFRWE